MEGVEAELADFAKESPEEGLSVRFHSYARINYNCVYVPVSYVCITYMRVC